MTSPSTSSGTTQQVDLAVGDAGFVVLAADPQSRKQVILILIVQSTLPQEGEATLTASVENCGSAIARITASATPHPPAGLGSSGVRPGLRFGPELSSLTVLAGQHLTGVQHSPDLQPLQPAWL